jgi:hypothetical protein
MHKGVVTWIDKRTKKEVREESLNCSRCHQTVPLSADLEAIYNQQQIGGKVDAITLPRTEFDNGFRSLMGVSSASLSDIQDEIREHDQRVQREQQDYTERLQRENQDWSDKYSTATLFA